MTSQPRPVFSSRSYHGRSFAPRKSTPSVSMANASGRNRNVFLPSVSRGHEKVPSSNRLLKSHSPGAVKVEHLQTRPAPFAEDKERPALQLLLHHRAHQPRQPLEPLAHVAGFQGHEDPHRSGKTQHRSTPIALNICPAHNAWSALVSSSHTAAPICTRSAPVVGGAVTSCAGTASTQRTVAAVANLAATPFLRRCWIHQARVGYFTPTKAANAAPLTPLRSYSSRICSRFSRGVQIAQILHDLGRCFAQPAGSRDRGRAKPPAAFR